MSLCFIALKSDVNLPELMVKKLNCPTCLVKFCWLGIISQAEDPAGLVAMAVFALEDEQIV